MNVNNRYVGSNLEFLEVLFDLNLNCIFAMRLKFS